MSTVPIDYSSSQKAKIPNLKVGIVGAGIGGVCLGSALSSKGFNVTIFEKSGMILKKLFHIVHSLFRLFFKPSFHDLEDLFSWHRMRCHASML